MTDITKQIKEKLVEIEKKENIRILYACESGSRAWGGVLPTWKIQWKRRFQIGMN